MKILNGILVCAFIGALFACSGYNKVLKSDDYKAKFEMANNLYEEKNYDRCVALYEQVYQRFPKESEGELSYYRIGKSYYNEDDYYMAGYFLGAFTQRFPFSAKVEEATFLSALCSVQNSPSPQLDQTETEVAINNLQQFIDRFPDSELIDTCNQIMDKLRFKIETKEFDKVKLYSKTEYYRAAVTSGVQFTTNYPTSIYKEEASYILVKNSYLLAKHSIQSKKLKRTVQTLERYRTFVNEFPNSKYSRELANYKKAMELEREKLEDKKNS